MRVIISEGRVKITRIGFLDVIDYVIIRIRPASRKRHHRPEALQEDTQEPMGTTTQLLLKSQRHCMSSAKKNDSERVRLGKTFVFSPPRTHRTDIST